MRKVNSLVALVVGGVCFAGLSARSDAAANVNVYYIGGGTQAYWVGTADSNVYNDVFSQSPPAWNLLPASPLINPPNLSPGFGDPKGNIPLAADWTWTASSTLDSATLPATSEYGAAADVTATSNVRTTVHSNGSFTFGGWGRASAQADINKPTTVLTSEGASGINIQFSVLSPQTLTLTGTSGTSGWGGTYSFSLTQYDTDTDFHALPGQADWTGADIDWTSVTLLPGPDYVLNVSVGAGQPYAEGSTADNASYLESYGSLNLSAAFVPEPTVAVALLGAGLLAMRRRRAPMA